ncbi:MAG: LysR family transcriptional regulator [Clostridia bacterium]|nr:LysR family transcriptional regulator [Clostridia bacterium]
MNFKELASFIAISKYKNFSKAAQALYLTQPTISNHIQALEDELKTTLLIRNSKSVSLTQSGRMLLIHAQKILNEKEQIQFMFDQYNDDISGELEIATSTIPSQYYLPKIIKGFSEKHPQMRFRIEKLDSAGVHKKLEYSEINFGIVGTKSSNEAFEYEKILSDTIVLCCDYNLDIPDGFEIQDIKKLPLIMREDGSGTRKQILMTLKEHHIQLNDLNIFSIMDDINTIKACIQDSDKFTFTSKIAIDEELNNKKLKIVPISNFEIKRDFYFVSNTKHTLTPMSDAFKKFILKEKY